MQQTNYTLNEFMLQGQSIQEQDPNKCILKESAEFQQFNPLGFSLFLEANCQQEVIAKQLFAQILKMIEDKLLELEQRLDNREEIKWINTQLIQFKPPDQYSTQKQNDDTQSDQIKQSIKVVYLGKFSQQSDIDIYSPEAVHQQDVQLIKSQKPLRSRSQVGRANTELMRTESKTKMNEEGILQKIEQFDKKIKVLTEQVNKMSQKETQFSKKIEQQINVQLKDCQDRLIQNEKLFKQVYSTNQEITENQRGFLTHLQQVRQEINCFSQDLTRISDENKITVMQIEQNYLELQKQFGEQKNELILQKSFLESIDNDFLMILKKFKDLQNDLAKKKFNSSQFQQKLLQ
ncbi:unnamed protein product (macronuclear) [Paramecium tetraurelia]|uniref:Uncharacterized protein n=1 Tax=Paramecium tetraurelia TaxID=5888 RepID=A0CYH4_PARTE|nr:uncharacterized protein GSPATT00011441001 [Paramecium tetraurelia]CAK75841.1 unnamed protein product [Paramecium tetraurelia]|eukprot:XP_001443238.1 hypothetical protein (macronuclear) [Paramecium tetraurelia strain d4-2]